jgi:hypothetical protein
MIGASLFLAPPDRRTREPSSHHSFGGRMRSRARLPLGVTPLLILLAACSERGSLPTQSRLSPDGALSAKTSSGSGAHTLTVTSLVSSDAGFQIRGDGLGAYKNSNTLISEIQSGTTGDWELDSSTPTGGTRQIFLDFSRPVAGSGPNGGAPVAIQSGSYRFHMISKCHLDGFSYVTIAPGQTVQCPLLVSQLVVGSHTYSVLMNPGITSGGASWPETNYTNVKCNSTAGSCASWTLTPSGVGPDGAPANVAVLFEVVTTTTKGKTTTTDVKQGDFYMSYRIDITNP